MAGFSFPVYRLFSLKLESLLSNKIGLYLLCPFVLILRQAQHKCKRTKKSILDLRRASRLRSMPFKWIERSRETLLSNDTPKRRTETSVLFDITYVSKFSLSSLWQSRRRKNGQGVRILS